MNFVDILRVVALVLVIMIAVGTLFGYIDWRS